eukprot:CAMPEP_0116926440 /NCGR_PEP_ID=MMETSP0467-20121206/24728_1 /TAXON_ID=283647 /ORGANISM="Mesodinium pulex, Strain SPMC105" /LENGTH=60 /DNA_ID=CAMNT_0004605701 /DNA_START=730 /DNA_END=912 /DNA_ORIENTATION=-
MNYAPQQGFHEFEPKFESNVWLEKNLDIFQSRLQKREEESSKLDLKEGITDVTADLFKNK